MSVPVIPAAPGLQPFLGALLHRHGQGCGGCADVALRLLPAAVPHSAAGHLLDERRRLLDRGRALRDLRAGRLELGDRHAILARARPPCRSGRRRRSLESVVDVGVAGLRRIGGEPVSCLLFAQSYEAAGVDRERVEILTASASAVMSSMIDVPSSDTGTAQSRKSARRTVLTDRPGRSDRRPVPASRRW